MFVCVYAGVNANLRMHGSAYGCGRTRKAMRPVASTERISRNGARVHPHARAHLRTRTPTRAHPHARAHLRARTPTRLVNTRLVNTHACEMTTASDHRHTITFTGKYVWACTSCRIICGYTDLYTPVYMCTHAPRHSRALVATHVHAHTHTHVHTH